MNAPFTATAAAAGMLLLSALAPTTAQAQGELYGFRCPSGYALVGLKGWQGWWMDRIQGKCARVNVDAGTVSSTDIRWTGIAGTSGLFPPPAVTKQCPSGTVITRFAGARTDVVLTIHSIMCADIAPGGAAAASGTWVTAFPKKDGGNLITTMCLDGRTGSGINGRAATSVHQFAIYCDFLPGVTQTVAAQPPPTAPAAPTGVAPGGVGLVAPANVTTIRGYQPGVCAEVDRIPRFDWTVANGAASYELELSNATAGTRRGYTATVNSRWITGLLLRAGNQYTWRVRGIGAGGMPGAWSGQRSILAIAGTPLEGPCYATRSPSTF